MPFYSYECPECHWVDEVMKSVTKHAEIERCRQCGAVMDRDYSAEGNRTNTGHCGDSYHREIHSDALAITPEQRAEHQQKYPDVKLDALNRPVFQNYRQHDAYLKARGVEHTTKQKWV